jgi:hypothetical protein
MPYDEKINTLINKFVADGSQNLVDYSQIDNKLSFESQPEYDIADNETLYKGKTNCYISLGGDRKSGPGSGFGTTPIESAAAIDLVAGSLGKKSIKFINKKKVYVGKNFNYDTSRVYISQKSNIDKYFGIPSINPRLGSGQVNIDNSDGKAAVALASDCIRLVARNNVKIVTQHMGYDSTNKSIIPSGIDLIAGYDFLKQSGMPQPMVRGDNLIKCLTDIIQAIEELRSITKNRFNYQDDINNRLLSHTHQSAVAGGLTSVMIEKQILSTIIDQNASYFENKNLSARKTTDEYKKIYFTAGKEQYINSNYNRTN